MRVAESDARATRLARQRDRRRRAVQKISRPQPIESSCSDPVPRGRGRRWSWAPLDDDRGAPIAGRGVSQGRAG